MKLAIFPGSFNPWHDGHAEIVAKALQTFDKVIIAQGVNPDKDFSEVSIPSINTYGAFGQRVQVVKFKGLLVDFIEGFNEQFQVEISAVVRGLRNATDLEHETCQQYWNEDLGLKIPTFYVVCGRDKRHISSSAIRAVNRIKVSQ